jgi:hypothetical protein
MELGFEDMNCTEMSLDWLSISGDVPSNSISIAVVNL